MSALPVTFRSSLSRRSTIDVPRRRRSFLLHEARRRFATGALVLAAVACASSASAEPAKRALGASNGPDLVRMLGPRAGLVLAPRTGLVGALVALPKGTRAADFGLEPVAPGIGRLRASPSRIDAFATAHPDLRIEVAPPVHTLLDRASQWVGTVTARQKLGADGRGVFVGVADTGVDAAHPDFIDASGHSRIAWLLDLSLPPMGVHADLEDAFGIKDSDGKVVAGAVLDASMIDAQLAKMKSGECVDSIGSRCASSDEVGHGTHVAGIAVSSASKYPGMAPAADLVFVRLLRAGAGGIENDDLVRAVSFMFDRADAAKKPISVNLSLGSDFGPHDGTFLWEQTIASYVGPDHPGRVIVAAAGNSGSIVESPIHQSVSVSDGATTRVPIRTQGANAGSVQVWVTLREGANLAIGLDGPDGEWIAPVASGHQNGKNTSDYNAGVIHGNVPDSPIPSTSRGGVVVWAGKWPSGNYAVTLRGSGMAELYLQSFGDASIESSKPAIFSSGVREGTVNLPATNPSIIGVGCTVNRARWTSIGSTEMGLRVPLLDPAGGLPIDSSAAERTRDIADGEVCWFSSAGPTATGVPKPDISAPGALVVSAMSRAAPPSSSVSMFATDACPPNARGASDNRCLQIDDTHAVGVGTSMSSPVVAGVAALLLQKDPTLTQDDVRALLQAGAHSFRGAAPFQDQAGPGEVDALGALDALDQMRNPALRIPSADKSWLSLSSDYVPADGSTTVTAIVELRTSDGAHRADMFDARRLAPVLLVDGVAVSAPPTMIRRGPGVWFFEWRPPRGLGGSRATFGATFDGAPIVASRTLPIATDSWNASYPSHALGSGCATSPGSAGGWSFAWGAVGVGLLVARRRRA